MKYLVIDDKLKEVPLGIYECVKDGPGWLILSNKHIRGFWELTAKVIYRNRLSTTVLKYNYARWVDPKYTTLVPATDLGKVLYGY